jgi:hypothetical protein
MCHSHHAVETRLHEEKNAQKKLQRDMKEVKKAPSLPCSKERESNPPTPFEQIFERYESFDPSQPYASYPSKSFDSPPPEQPRPSITDQLTTDILGDPTPGMASSAHTSFTHTTIPTYFDSSLYIGPGSHWAQPHDYPPHDTNVH